MTKKDLKPMMVLQTAWGDLYLYVGTDTVYNISNNIGHKHLSDFDDTLEEIPSTGLCTYTIARIFEPVNIHLPLQEVISPNNLIAVWSRTW